MPTRLFLVVVGALFAVIAWHTPNLPADYLVASDVWSAVAAVTAASCWVTAFVPLKATMAVAGASIVCASWGRAVALVTQIATADHVGTAEANYWVAASVWGLVGSLAFLLWWFHVAPWSALRRER